MEPKNDIEAQVPSIEGPSIEGPITQEPPIDTRHRLSWCAMTVVLIVEAIALGTLTLPSAYSTLGMAPGILLTILVGLVAAYTSHTVGRVKLLRGGIHHYADAGRILLDPSGTGRRFLGVSLGSIGYEVVGAMFVLQLVLLVASHCLAGTIALGVITGGGACSVVLGVVSALVLLLLAVPPAFADLEILGYVDCASVLAAVGVVVVATGLRAASSEGGIAGVDWSMWPKETASWSEAVVAVSNIVFAYSFTITQFTIMNDMQRPQDYPKAVWALTATEIIVYTLTGALVYAFVGVDVASPALLSGGPLTSKVAFGVGLPVIFISGSINTTVVGRYIHDRIWAGRGDERVRLVQGARGWVAWLALVSALTAAAFVVAQSIPFFNDLLSLSSSLLITGFSFYMPALMWFVLLREGSWSRWSTLAEGLLNGAILVIGVAILVGGTASSVLDIVHKYDDGNMMTAFSC